MKGNAGGANAAARSDEIENIALVADTKLKLRGRAVSKTTWNDILPLIYPRQ